MPTDRHRSSNPRLQMALALLAVAVLCAGCGGGRSSGSGNSAGRGSQLFGVFLGSDQSGIAQIPAFEKFLGGTKLRVGHTYLPGAEFTDLEGPPALLDPWAEWHSRNPQNLFVLNVPMAAPNEGGEFQQGPVLGDDQVADLLRKGAAGEYDRYFTVLAQRLVDRKLDATVIVPGWEMNGETYSHRCAPDPASWKLYFQHVVKAMRSVSGQNFLFDFNPSRGTDVISWKKCYPGDDVVDIIGMDTYDQPPGENFGDYVSQPDGLQDQVDFAADHGKPVSYPEWGLFRYGDNPEFIRKMHDWITSHNTMYSTLTDYCPHGVLTCQDNPQSAAVVQQLFGK